MELCHIIIFIIHRAAPLTNIKILPNSGNFASGKVLFYDMGKLIMTDMYKQVDGVRIKMTVEEIAEHDSSKNALEETPVLSDFDYAITNLRGKRNSLLAETDWMANSDVTMSEDMKTIDKN